MDNNNQKYHKLLKLSSNILKIYILFGLVFVIIYPFIVKFSLAFRSGIDNTNPLVYFIPENFTLNNFIRAYNRLDYSTIVQNTFMLSIVTSIIQVIATAISGYAFAQLRFKGSNFLFYFILISITIPKETIHISRILFFNTSGFLFINLIGNVYSIFIMSAFGMGIRSAIFIYLFRQYFKKMPIELIEAAQIDGASVLSVLFKVSLPYSMGAISTVFLMSFVWQWNDFYYPNLFNISQDGFAIFASKFFNGRMVYINESSLLMMMPLFFGYFIFQNIFLDSVNRFSLVD